MPTTYEKIATTTLGSAAASITFSSIPSTYTDLRIVLVAKGDQDQNTSIRFNSDTATNYSYTRLSGNGTTAESFANTSVSNVLLGQSGIIEQFALITIDVFSYAGSTFKTLLSSNSNSTNGVDDTLNRLVGLWRSTSAINTVLLYQVAGNYVAGTTATIYGILKA